MQRTHLGIELTEFPEPTWLLLPLAADIESIPPAARILRIVSEAPFVSLST